MKLYSQRKKSPKILSRPSGFRKKMTTLFGDRPQVSVCNNEEHLGLFDYPFPDYAVIILARYKSGTSGVSS